jgi:hypothetical protein
MSRNICTTWKCFTHRRKRATGIHLEAGWLGPGTRQNDLKRRKILPVPGLELRSFRRPTRIQ